MALAMGSIMAVVAVLLNHIDRKEEVIIMPKISLDRKERQVESYLIYYYATIPTIISAIKCDLTVHTVYIVKLCQMVKLKSNFIA